MSGQHKPALLPDEESEWIEPAKTPSILTRMRQSEESQERMEAELRRTALEEKRRASIAPTFDRLIDANLNLTLAVGRLVRATYAILALQLVVMSAWVYLLLHRT